MKYILFPLIIANLFNFALAQNVIITSNKGSALAACNEKVTYLPEKVQSKMLASCRCVVEHTDFNKVVELQKLRNQKKLQDYYQQIDKTCESW